MKTYIRKGVPLPKGHGRIGDLDALRCENADFDIYNDYYTMFDEIDAAETIIGADKEGGENQKQADDEIKIGDEVKNFECRGIVVKVDESLNAATIFWVDRCSLSTWSIESTKEIKTGRHFSQMSAT